MRELFRENLASGSGRNHRSLRSSAFTLIELMIVVALVAIMAAMIVPEMKGSMEDALLRASARKLVDVFNLTYSQAVSLGEQHRVLLDNATGRYRVERQKTDSLGRGQFLPVTEIPELEGQIDPRIEIQMRPGTSEMPDPELADAEVTTPRLAEGINFYADGTADGCQFRLRDRMGVELVLQLNPITGNVQMLNLETP